MAKTCFGCIHLDEIHDAAGGGLYKCKKVSGLVLGEWGHWMPEDGTPRPLREDCHDNG